MFFDVDTSRWPQASYSNPPLAGTYLIPVEYSLLAISTVVVTMRLVSRGYFLKCLGLDDYCAIVSWMFATILIISNIIMITCGYGRHIYDVEPKQRMYVLFHAWLYQWAATASTGFSKLSICFFFLRFIPGRTARIAVHMTIIYIIAWSTAMTGVWFFRCRSFSAWWTQQVPKPGTCMSSVTFIRLTGLNAAFGASSHFLMFFLPLSTLWKLDLPRSRKLWMAFVLWIGGACCVFAAARIYYTVLGVQNEDATWYGYKALLFQALEIHSQVIYTCMPFLGPAVHALYSPLLSSLRKFSGSNVAETTGNRSVEFVSIDAARISQTAAVNLDLPQRTFNPTLDITFPPPITPPYPPPSLSYTHPSMMMSFITQPMSPTQLSDVERAAVDLPPAYDDVEPSDVAENVNDADDVEARSAVSVRLTSISGRTLRRITIA